MTKRVGKMVRVTWQDAFSEENVDSVKDLAPLVKGLAQTHGVCLVDNTEEMVIAGEVFEWDNSYRDVSHIPTGIIRKVEILK